MANEESDRSAAGWLRRLSLPAQIVSVFLAISALAFGWTEAVDQLPFWLLAALVTMIGVTGLVLVSREEWSRDAKRSGPGCLGLLLSLLPLPVWRLVLGILSLGIIALGLGGLLDTLL